MMRQSTGLQHQTRLRTLLRGGRKTVRQVLGRLDERHWRAIQYLFVALALVVAAATLRASWASLSSFDWELDFTLFGLSSLLVSAAILSVAVWWTLSLRLMREQLSWRHGIRIWALSQLAKYLPGGVWNYVGRAYACERAGVSRNSSALSLVVETVLRVQAAVIVFLASLPFWPDSEWSDAAPLYAAGILLIGFLALHPRILGRASGLLQRVLRSPPVDIASVDYRHILGLLVGHVLTVGVAGIAFHLMVASVHPVPASAALPLSGMLSLSVIVGFLNPLTPHGLGTREGLLILLLGFYLPLPAAIVISLLSRLWMTASELVGILVVAALFRT